MTSDATVVVRYDEASRAAVEQTLHNLVRKQGILLLILGTLLGLLVLVPFIGAATAADGVDAAFVFAAIAMLVVPIAIGALGVRQLRRQPHLPEVAVTITPAAVLFPAIDRPSALAPRIRAAEWTREGTSAEIIPASGLQLARVEFTRQDGGKRRRRSIAAGNLDVDATVIVDALRGPHN
ncbi:hypothetical protein GCM10027413_26360 [Conyzicola nivalis]|uniref:Uncharacterized protein n=1 Tax=Conyzicola nivalis TaxID=1477021 RepID=A0A916S963_9MICO|nr:hypothetical protein [Conyzicola nivalis]GGA89467.1 hypothetical protein GCM10010979_00250 [Conyzicola nivalis]